VLGILGELAFGQELALTICFGTEPAFGFAVVI
jgi:hypothetical protein